MLGRVEHLVTHTSIMQKPSTAYYGNSAGPKEASLIYNQYLFSTGRLELSFYVSPHVR